MCGRSLLIFLLLSVPDCRLELPELSAIISELNWGLQCRTNIIYLEHTQPKDLYDAIRSTVPSILLSGSANRLTGEMVSKPLLVVLPQPGDRILERFAQLPTAMQEADYLLVGQKSADHWQGLISGLWSQGYPNVLVYNGTAMEKGTLYTSEDFPQQRLGRTNVSHYLWARRHWFDDLGGLEVRVALYNNPPRTLVYPEHGVYDGYALMLLRQFLAHRRATFVPVLTPHYRVYSANDCLKLLHLQQVDICGDLLAYSNISSFTASYTYLYGYILIANSPPRSKVIYTVAPYSATMWMTVAAYLVLLPSVGSLVYWLQRGTIRYGKFVLDALKSLLSSGFQLGEIRGLVGVVLYLTLVFTGFICSNFYLAALGSILATGLYEPQINTFEELVQQNITFIIGDYDKTVLQTYDFPDILWNITRVVPYDFITRHRAVFDTDYAYLAHSDRTVLFNFQQQFMKKPRMRPLPIELMHTLPGFPMRRQWLLKQKLGETLLNCFNSGLLEKLAHDTNRETIRIGYLGLIRSEEYRAQPLALDFFSMPFYMMFTGLGLAFVSLVGELLVHLLARGRRASPQV
ncbi:uncharacterized protein LOC108158030 [Drosophila miranda]|uniref:uncharacterized protein LOC108158030 n=1 Tax=Drosophila miranda TaxID=7229 RepID=UPI0007E610B6|nr:uncharacterized protein LOC108158030 [Drosophila miranda]